VLYPQNGDRIMTTDSVTSLHPMYTQTNAQKFSQVFSGTARVGPAVTTTVFVGNGETLIENY